MKTEIEPLEEIDLSELLGLSLEEAEMKVASFGWLSRPVRINGRALIVTDDLRRNRVGLDLVGDKVVGVMVG